MNVVLNGGDPDYVALLPSGFSILPDGSQGSGEVASSGSLLTVAFQILVDSVPTAKLSLGSVATVNNLIACTVERISASLSPRLILVAVFGVYFKHSTAINILQSKRHDKRFGN